MVRIEQVSAEEFDWDAEDGPAADVRRIARAATAHDGSSTLNEQAVLQLKYRGLRNAGLWLALGFQDLDKLDQRTAGDQQGAGGDQRGADDQRSGAAGFALRHGDLLDLAVQPDARGQGVGTALAAAALPSGRKVEAWSHGDHPAASRIASRFGIPRERELKVMRRSLGDPLPPVTVPEGVTIRSFEPGDEQAVLDVNATAFAHHPEQGHMTMEDLRERMSEAWFDPAGLFLAVPDEPGDLPLLGFHWTKVHTDEDPAYGEVYVVAVNPKAAGRGLGTVLTGVGLEHLKERGLDSVLLYVDGDNDPAIAVYTGQGFVVERTEVQYRGVSTGGS